MDIEQAVYEILSTDAEIISRVAGRIFSGVQYQEVVTYPAIVYRSGGQRRVVRVLESGCALVSEHIHVFSAGKKYQHASLLDRTVIQVLDEYRNTVVLPNTSPPETITIQGIFLTPLAHEYDYVDKNSLHQFVSEFECHFLDPSRLD